MIGKDLFREVTFNYYLKDEKKSTVTGQEVENIQGRGNQRHKDSEVGKKLTEKTTATFELGGEWARRTGMG